jgi:hypothetical protein
MAYPTSRTDDSAEAVAVEIDGQASATLDQLESWRVRIAAGGDVSGSEAHANYQRLTALRTFMAAKIAADPVGITDAYHRHFTDLGPFDPVAEEAVSRAAIDSFKTWFQTNWPKTTQGWPAFAAYGSTGELVDLAVPLTTNQRNTVISRIDAVLAAFL